MSESSIRQAIEDKYSRYYLVNLAFDWARYIRDKKSKTKVLSEIVDQAITDLMEGKVSLDEIENLIKKNDEDEDESTEEEESDK